MTERERDPDSERPHAFSEGPGFGDPYESFDLDPPVLSVDPTTVDPVDSRVLTDLLDEQNVARDDVDAVDLIDVGLSYVGIHRHEQAAEAFERAARFAEDPTLEQEAWVNKGVAHAELEEWDEAIGAYRQALSIDVDGHAATEHAATAETNLAYALWESGDTALALEHAERAVELDERLPQAWYNRAFFLHERGLVEDARFCIDNAIRLGMRTGPVLEEKARILEELGEHERAEAVAERADELRQEAERTLVEDG